HPRARAGPRAVGSRPLYGAGQVPARAPAGGGEARAPYLAAIERQRLHAHDRLATIGEGISHGADDEPARRFGIDDHRTVAHGSPPTMTCSRVTMNGGEPGARKLARSATAAAYAGDPAAPRSASCDSNHIRVAPSYVGVRPAA